MVQGFSQTLHTARDWALLLLLVLVLLTPAAFADIPATATVVNGQGDYKQVTGRVVVNAPADAVWLTMTDYNGLKGFLPGYLESHVLQNNGASKTVQLGVKVSKLLPIQRYQVKINENKAHYQINIQRISGDFKAINARYSLIPAANGSQTVVTYQLQIALGDKIPNIGVSSTLKHSTEDTLNAIRAQAAVIYRKSIIAKQ